jgi:U3 small nucleolar RNA-associated protein 13
VSNALCHTGTHADLPPSYVPSSSSVVSIHADQNILFHSLATSSLSQQIVGFNDEIVDASFLSSSTAQDSHLALATNSSLIRVYSTKSHDARLLEGHADIVLALDRGHAGQVLASGSKDRSARIWAPLNSDREWGWACVGVCEGHAESVGAVALSRKSLGEDGAGLGLRFLFTGSQDRTIKMWDISQVTISATADTEPMKCKSLSTMKAHDKDINSLDVAPTDRLLASGSQDKTAKVYEIEYISTKSGIRGELKLLGVCKGHKRGVWTVRFSKAERVLATGSGDKTIRLWNLDDFSCVKTFEGHTNSVLRVDFLNAGMQMVSTASDGLVKVWNVRDEECVTTLDGHEDKIWALAVSGDERTIVSGAADSVINFWQDSTEEQEQQKESKRAAMVSK